MYCMNILSNNPIQECPASMPLFLDSAVDLGVHKWCPKIGSFVVKNDMNDTNDRKL